MSGKLERQQARAAVAAYHEARLSELVTHVAGAIDRFREGEPDAFGVDRVLLQYSRAARELWKFCNMTDVDMTARFVRDKPLIDRWETRGAQEAVSTPPALAQGGDHAAVHALRNLRLIAACWAPRPQLSRRRGPTADGPLPAAAALW